MDVFTNYLLCILCIQVSVLTVLVSEKVESPLINRSLVKALSLATSVGAGIVAIITLLNDLL